MSPRRTSAGPAPYRVALAVSSGVVVVRSVLVTLDGLDRVQGLTLADPLWAALAVLLVLLLGPYVKEVEAVGARVVTRDTGPSARDTAGELAEAAAGRDSLEPDGGWDEDEAAELAAGRYLGVLLALDGATTRFPTLAGARLHLYVPDDGGRLVPVLEHDDPVVVWSHGWDPGTGVVGRAWERRRAQVGRAPALADEVRGLSDKPVQAFAGLQVVLAVPLLNFTGRPVGVLSAASSDPTSELDCPAAHRELEAAAAGLTRVLVDLAGWATDEPEQPA